MNEIGPERQTIRMAKANRRAFYIVLLFILCCYIPIYYVFTLMPDGNVSGLLNLIAIFSVFCIPHILFIAPKWWIIDERGIMDCSIFGKVLWTWEDFRSGKIVRNGDLGFYDQRKPRFRQFLNFFRGEESEVEALITRIEALIPNPPRFELPTFLVVHVPYMHLILTPRKIMVENGKNSYSVNWEELRLAAFLNLDKWRGTYKLGVLILPDREFQFVSKTPQPKNLHAIAEKERTLFEFVQKYCPADRFFKTDDPQEMIDHPDFVKFTAKKEKNGRMVARFFCGAYLLALGSGAIYAYLHDTGKDHLLVSRFLGVIFMGMLFCTYLMERHYHKKFRSYSEKYGLKL